MKYLLFLDDGSPRWATFLSGVLVGLSLAAWLTR